MIRAACFDLDGTLVDTELLWARALEKYLADIGCAMPLEDVSSLVYGHAWSHIHASLARLFPGPFEARPSKTAAAELQIYYERQRDDPASIIIPSSLEFFMRTAEI
ncbi:MAG: hypothetical protein FWF96_00875, partial [Kiritimatiellaeota bacterium]|nr:hypothetical protein [Kiritimatiellota bacterium]